MATLLNPTTRHVAVMSREITNNDLEFHMTFIIRRRPQMSPHKLFQQPRFSTPLLPKMTTILDTSPKKITERPKPKGNLLQVNCYEM